MRLSECKENCSHLLSGKHSRSYHAAKVQNIFQMVVTLQPFLIQFARFIAEKPQDTLKTTFYLNLTAINVFSSLKHIITINRPLIIH